MVATQGLVLHTTKYGESSLIAKIFTRELGLCSYMVKGIRSPKGKTKQNLLQPLSHLDMVVYNNAKHDLQYVKDMHPAAHYSNTMGNSIKMALLFFMDEVLYKSLKEDEPNVPLFDYVVNELLNIDSAAHEELSNTPIEFLLHVSRHLGIEPMNNYSVREPYFNLKEGRFLSAPSVYAANSDANVDYMLDVNASSSLHSVLECSMSHSAFPHLSMAGWRSTLNNLLEYYHIHLPDFRNFTSHQVLHAVLR